MPFEREKPFSASKRELALVLFLSMVSTGALVAGCDSQTEPSGLGLYSTSSALDAEESVFLTLINTYRLQNGLGPLQLSPTLIAASHWMSEDMATHNYLGHTDSLGRDLATRLSAFNFTIIGTAGENVAAGNSDAQNTFAQWQNSPPHNANMLGSSYTQIGIGRAYDASSAYGWYWTTDFSS